MKRICMFFVFITLVLMPVVADQYQVIRTDFVDAQGKVTNLIWKDWAYFNVKNIMVATNEGSIDGREFLYKYEINPKWLYPSTKTAYIVKDKDPKNISTTVANYKTTYLYNDKDILISEITVYGNGDKTTIQYKRDANFRLISRIEDKTIGPEKTKTKIEYKYTYIGSTFVVASMERADGNYSEKNTYNAANNIIKKEISGSDNSIAYQTYQYNEFGSLTGMTNFSPDNAVVSKESYMYGLYKPINEVQGNIDNWLITYRNDIASLEALLKKYYFYVSRNAQYNDQLRQAYYLIGSMYFQSEKYETAIFYYKKALSYAAANVAGTERIDLLRNYFYYDWNIKTLKNKGPEYYCAYDCACALTLMGEFDEALLWLDFSLRIGFNEPDTIKNDKDLDFLRQAYEDDYNLIIARKWTPQ